MTPYNEILKLNSEGVSNSEIERRTGVTRKTVRDLLNRAELYDVTYPVEPPMTDTEIHRRLHPKETDTKPRPDMEAVLFELSIPDIQIKDAWADYAAECKNNGKKCYSLSMFQNYVIEARTQYAVPEYRSMMILQYVNGAIKDNKDRTSGLLIGRLLGSGYTALALVPDKENRAFVHALNKVIEDLDCSPQDCIIHGRITGTLLDIVKDCLSYYGIRSGRNSNIRIDPKDVTAIVTDVQQEIADGTDASFAIRTVATKNNSRLLPGMGHLTINDAHTIECKHLWSLQSDPYNLYESIDVSVAYNHVKVDGMYYSVPYEHRHDQLTAIVSDWTIEIEYGGEPLCSHDRLAGREGQYRTDYRHLPKKDIPHGETSGTSLRNWAAKIGEYTHRTIDLWLLKCSYECQAYRVCDALLHMSKQYGNDAIERACHLAWDRECVTYSFIKDIITNKSVPSEQ